MKKYRQVFSMLLVVALAAGVAFWLRPNDSKRIKKRFHQACSILSKSSAENPAVMAFKMFDFGTICADSVTLEIQDAPIKGTLSNEMLISELTRYRTFCNSISINPLDVEVNVTTPTSATAECVVQAKIDGSDFAFDEIRHFQLRLQKIEKSWKITALADNEILAK